MGAIHGGRIASTGTPREAGANPSTSANPFSDEYKILQDKIDKIGAFRVTIKGWSVTATIAVLLAIASNKGFSPTIGALGLAVLLVFFFWFERKQVRLGWMFNARARNIEIQIDKFRRKAGERVLFSSPNIARSLFGVKKRRDSEQFVFKNRTLEMMRVRISSQYRLAIGSDLIFYIALAFVAWLTVYLRSPTQPPTSPIVIQNMIQVPKQVTPAPNSEPTNSGLPTPSKVQKDGAK